MDCPKCGAEMKKFVLTPVFQVSSITKKWNDGETQSGVNCFGCPKCGYIEFYAVNLTWDTPVSDKCPKCGDGTTLFKKGGRMFCLKEGCGYEVAIKKEK